MVSDWLFTAAELRRSPSRLDGVTPRSELLRRAAACRLVSRVGASLRLSLAAQRAACVFLHRFLMRRSLARCDETLAAAACLLVASKSEEDPVAVPRLARAVERSPRQLLQMEGDVLLALSFELEVEHAFELLEEQVAAVAALLQPEKQQKLRQAAWSFLNDSAITCACLRVDAPLLAKAAAFAAGLFEGCVPSQTKTKQGEPWWTALTAPLEELEDAARHVLAAYSTPFVETSALPAGLVELVSRLRKDGECESELAEDCAPTPEGPESAQCEPLDADLKVAIDAQVLFESVEGSPAGDRVFVERTTAWIDNCLVSAKDPWDGEESPCDPCEMETCSQRPLAFKRSLLTENLIVKRAKLVL